MSLFKGLKGKSGATGGDLELGMSGRVNKGQNKGDKSISKRFSEVFESAEDDHEENSANEVSEFDNVVGRLAEDAETDDGKFVKPNYLQLMGLRTINQEEDVKEHVNVFRPVCFAVSCCTLFVLAGVFGYEMVQILSS